LPIVKDDAMHPAPSPELFYPFYLDIDMSMAFAAALTGGVALEEELVERAHETSEALKRLGGKLNVWRAGALEAAKQQAEGTAVGAESRLIRHQTVASIFIDLYQELRQSGRLSGEENLDNAEIGQLVALQVGPAVAPLRRVVDQLIRLLNVMAPVLGDSEDDEVGTDTRQQRRARDRAAAKHVATDQEQGLQLLRQLRRLFIALRDDLDHSGMIDMVVRREGKPSVVLTLDKRFVTPLTLELLHTSEFMVVGKLTQTWTEADQAVNLYRRSVLSLVPSLGQSISWAVFALLATMSRGFDPKAMERSAWTALGVEPPQQANPEAPKTETNETARGPGPADQATEDTDPSSTRADDAPAATDVIIGDDVAALYPAVAAPVVQILPLAICS
jgi:hypothetical protein